MAAIQLDKLTALHWTFIGGGIYLLMLICGGFGAFVANQQGRSGLDGFLLGFLLGPIGIAWQCTRRRITEYERAIRSKSGQEREIRLRMAERYQQQPHEPLREFDERRRSGTA